MTEMHFSPLETDISEESIWKLRSLPYAIWFLWNLSRIFNGMPHCSIIPVIRARENGSAMACVNLWLKTLRLWLSSLPPLCSHPSFPPVSSSFCLLGLKWLTFLLLHLSVLTSSACGRTSPRAQPPSIGSAFFFYLVWSVSASSCLFY